MTRIIDVNRHGIRREIDHQYKPKKKVRKPRELSTSNKKLSTDTRKDIDISIVSEPDVRP
jgi:hypothetical protein